MESLADGRRMSLLSSLALSLSVTLVISYLRIIPQLLAYRCCSVPGSGGKQQLHHPHASRLVPVFRPEC